jgi:hypothetical protein
MSAGFFATVGILGLFMLFFGFIVLMRYIGYRETLSLAEKGLVRAERGRGSDGKDTLRWGIVIAAIGLALSVGLYPIGLLPGMKFPLGLGPWMLAGFLPLFFGLGLILIYVLTRETDEERSRREQPDEPKRPPQA